MKKIAEVLQKDVDLMLSAELEKCDHANDKLGDAFLIQAIDSIQHLMSKRASMKMHAEKLEGVAQYYAQIYPQEFVTGLTQDYAHPGKSAKPAKKK